MHEKLVEKHSHLGRIIPPAPEKNLVGTTKAKFQGGGDAGGAVNGSSRYSHKSYFAPWQQENIHPLVTDS